MKARALAFGWLLTAVPAMAQDAPRREALARAESWLLTTVDQPDWIDQGAQGNERGKRVVAQSLTAWLLSVRDADACQRLEERTAGVVSTRGVADVAFATWTLASTSFCLAECSLRDGDAHPQLATLARRLGELRNSEGAWAHGSMEGMIEFYPSTLVAATNWALWSLGLAREFGVDVPSEWMDTAAVLLRDVQASNGGVPYGGRPYRLGIEAGRTAGSVLAWTSIGLTDSSMFSAAAAYVRQNMARVPEGHASPAMHILNGAVCAWLLGDDAWQSYERDVMSRLLEAQQDDGTFLDILGERSPDSMELMGSAISNSAYVTALYSAALAVPDSRLGSWCRRRAESSVALRNESIDLGPSTTEVRELPPAWTTSVKNGVGVAVAGAEVLVATRDGWELFDRAQGSAGTTVSTSWDLADDIEFTVHGDRLISFDPDTGALHAFALSDGTRTWNHHLVPNVKAPPFIGLHAVYDIAPGGALTAYRLEDGTPDHLVDHPHQGLRSLLRPLDDGACIVTSDRRIACYDRAGTRRWHGRNRDDVATVPASWTCLTRAGDTFVGGSSDGTVIARRLDDGRAVWTGQVGTAALQLEADPAQPERLFVLDAAATLTAMDAGVSAWSIDLSGGAQDPEGHASRFVLGATGIWVHVTGRERLLRVDMNGDVQGAAACGADQPWAAQGDDAYVLHDETLIAFAANR